MTDASERVVKYIKQKLKEDVTDEKLSQLLRVLVIVQTEQRSGGALIITKQLDEFLSQSNTKVLEIYMGHLAAVKSENYDAVMEQVAAALLSDPSEAISCHSQQVVKSGDDFTFTIVAGILGVLRSLPKQQIAQIATKIGSFSAGAGTVAIMVGRVGVVANIVLTAAVIAIDVLISMRKWWKGEISGKRCAKNILESFGSAAGAAGGAIAGAGIGVVAGPVGAAVGAVVGGLTVGVGSKVLLNKILSSIFDLPKNAALEQAYKFFEVHHKASDAHVNKSYYRKCLEHHPDKEGSREKWDEVQMQLQIIRFARQKDL